MTDGFFNQLKTLNQREGPVTGSVGNSVLLVLVLAGGYFGLGRLAFAMAVSEGSATSVAFLPEGLALAFAIIFGARVGPGIFLGQMALSLSLGVPLWVAAVFGGINMVEDCVGGWLFWRWRIAPALGRPRDVATLFALSALVLQPAAALAKAFPRLAISAPEDIVHLSLYSWAGNTMGQFLVTPLLLAWCSAGFRFQKRELIRGLLIVATFFGGILLFKMARLGEIDRLYWLAIFGGFYLVLIWSAVESGTLTTALTNLLTTMGLLWVITSSPDSLLYFSTQDRVLYADVLILGGIVTALLIAALFGQLGERTMQLQQANAAKERIFAVIGHDLRSPIASLQTSLELLKSGTLEREEFLEFQEDLHAGVEHARWTLENLMEWGALQLDELQPHVSDVSLQNAAAETVLLLNLQAGKKRIQVENLISGEALVRADRHQVASILRNLLSNALKFTPPEGRVTLSARARETDWEFAVRDTGIGMSREQAGKLFAKDREFTSTLGTAKERGLGLGLRITLDFVEANGGTIRVESAPDKGTVFHVTLPKARESEGSSHQRQFP